MPISPLRMSVMRGSTVGTVNAFKPLEKEVYTLGSKAKAKLGGRVLKGTETKSKKSSDTKPVDRLEGGPAWQKKDQSKKATLSGSSTNDSATINKQDKGFNKLAAGSKSYGQTGRKAPNVGPVSNKLGYAKRDAKLSAAKTAKSSYFETSRKKK